MSNRVVSGCLAVLFVALATIAGAQTTDHDDPDCDTPPADTTDDQPEWLEGRGENELVLIHGLGGSNEVWSEVVPYLVNAFRVELYELHGHGTTRPLSDATIASETAALRAWIEDRDIVYPTLVGHGLGGMIAMQYAFDHPVDVRRLMVIDSGPRQIASEEHKVTVAQAILDDYDRFVASRFISISRDQEVCEAAVDWALRTDAASFASLLLSSFNWDLTDELPRQSVPMLVIGSAAYFPEAGYERAFLEQYGFGSARTLSFKRVADTGHYLMLEKPTYIASVITVFAHGELRQ